jgi:hypothetical protein
LSYHGRLSSKPANSGQMIHRRFRQRPPGRPTCTPLRNDAGIRGHQEANILRQSTTQAGSYCVDKDVHMTEGGSAGATTSDGTHLFVLDEGQGEPLLLVPGLGCATWCWVPVAPLSRAARVLALDNRARGVPASCPAPTRSARWPRIVVGPDCPDHRRTPVPNGARGNVAGVAEGRQTSTQPDMRPGAERSSPGIAVTRSAECNPSKGAHDGERRGAPS